MAGAVIQKEMGETIASNKVSRCGDRGEADPPLVGVWRAGAAGKVVTRSDGIYLITYHNARASEILSADYSCA